MKYKIGICIDCNFTRYIYSQGRCERCYWRWRSTIKKKRSFVRGAVRGSEIEDKSQIKLFYEIWAERDHISIVSGIKLLNAPGSRFWFWYFAHVLPKGKYPDLKYKKDNIQLLTQHEHYLYDHGTEKQRQNYANKQAEKGIAVNWDILYHLRIKLRETASKRDRIC